MRALILAVLFLLALPDVGADAVQPNEVLKDPELEARARNLSKDIRCLVCQNQSIDDSNADLARDLRVLVRQRLTKGDSDEQIFDFLVNRYGDFVLLKPPVKSSTYALWYGPIVIFIFGVIGLIVYLRGRRPLAAPQTMALSEDEERRISALIDKNNKISE
jgi:cytochrome c-type biogenesis protein CcmH